MKKLNKKKTIILIFFICLIFITILPTFSYFSDSQKLNNTITIGNNIIEPEEDFETPSVGNKTIKNPKVKNVGKVNCYVRAQVLLSDNRSEKYFDYYTNNKVGFNTSDWIINDDGWFYYKYKLKVNEKTSPIFTHILLKEELPQNLKDIFIDVSFESVQSDNFSNSKDAFQYIKSKEVL